MLPKSIKIQEKNLLTNKKFKDFLQGFCRERKNNLVLIIQASFDCFAVNWKRNSRFQLKPSDDKDWIVPSFALSNWADSLTGLHQYSQQFKCVFWKYIPLVEGAQRCQEIPSLYQHLAIRLTGVGSPADFNIFHPMKYSVCFLLKISSSCTTPEPASSEIE